MILNILIAVLLLGVIILVHEFGHFIVAKANGVCVVEFSIGFGPRIFSFRRGETDYCIKALFFGGSCRMLSEAEDLYTLTDEQLKSKGHEFEKQSMKLIKKYGRDGAIESKSPAARIAISLAGPVYNFLLAFVLGTVMIGFMGYDTTKVDYVTESSEAFEKGIREGDTITAVDGVGVVFNRELTDILDERYKVDGGEKPVDISYISASDGKENVARLSPTVDVESTYKAGISLDKDGKVSQLQKDSPAEKSGLKTGDVIKKINGNDVTSSEEIVSFIQDSDGKELDIAAERNGQLGDYRLTPELTETKNINYGFECYGKRERTSPVKTLYYSVRETGYWIHAVIGALGDLFTGKMSPANLSGPVGTVSVLSDVVGQSRSQGVFIMLMTILYMGIMLSANIGVMNLIPIPALDGGRLLLLICEVVAGRPLSKEKEGVVDFIGAVFVIILMFFVFIKDIVGLFT